jgi:uncharacterized protein
MELKHEFIVPIGAAEAWHVLLDVERIALCMPGATVLDVRGDEFTGTVKVKVGPITMTYSGSAKFAEKHESERRVVVDAVGKESRGLGTAKAIVTATLTPSADGVQTTVRMLTDLTVTGRPAQFGRGMLQDIGGELISQFSDRLAETLLTDSAATEPAPDVVTTGGEQRVVATLGRPTRRPVPFSSAGAQENEPIDLLEVSGVSGLVAKYKMPLAAGAVGVLLLWLLVDRRRRSG